MMGSPATGGNQAWHSRGADLEELAEGMSANGESNPIYEGLSIGRKLSDFIAETLIFLSLQSSKTYADLVASR